MFLTSRNNEYPFYYEKDAHSKVAQVVSGYRNFYHPMLMLNATDVGLRVANLERTEHNAVVVGRWFMAFCTAAAVAAFALLAYRLRGPLAAICVGVLLMTHNLVFELAHFFKEDPALLMGLALAFLAMQHFSERPSRANAVWMAIGCALAVSGKYVGIAAFIMALYLLWLRGRTPGGARRPMPWGLFIGVFVAVTLLLNYQIVTRFQEFLAGFEIEMKDVSRPSKRKDIPHLGQAGAVFTKLVHPWIFILAAIQIALTLVRRPRKPVEWLLFLYPAIFLVVLLYSPRLFTRHFLPVIAFLCVLAGFGLPALVELVWAAFKKVIPPLRRTPAWVPVVLVLVLLGLAFRQAQRPMLWKRYKAFQHPTREMLIAYVNEHLPTNAVIATDRNTFLVDPEGNPREDLPVRCQVLMKGRLAYFESVDALYELGVTHIAAHSRSSPRLFAKGASGKAARKGEREDDPAEDVERESDETAPNGPPVEAERDLTKMRNYMQGKEFYEELVKVVEEVTYIPSGRTAYIAPALKLFKLKPRPAAVVEPTEPTEPSAPSVE